MLRNGVYKLKQDTVVKGELKFDSGQELEIVNNVVYIQGFPVSHDYQSLLINWMERNPKLFLNDTRIF
jgi:hypothetical protein